MNNFLHHGTMAVNRMLNVHTGTSARREKGVQHMVMRVLPQYWQESILFFYLCRSLVALVINSLNIVCMVEEVELDKFEKFLRALLAFRPECIVKSAVPVRQRRVGRDEKHGGILGTRGSM